MPLDLTNVSQRAATFHFELLNSSGTYIGGLPVSQSSVPTISHDTTRSINRTLNRLLFDSKTSKDINPFADKVRPMMTVDSRTWSLGVYLFGSASLLRSSVGDFRTASLVDQTFQVNQPVERSISFSKGTLLTSAISIVIAETGDFEIQIDPSPAAVGDSPLAWKAGTPALTIINDICTMIGYYPLYFNNAGVGIVRTAVDTSAASPNIIYDLGGSIYDQSLVESDNLLEVPNRYIVIDTSAITKPIVGYYDVPASFPHSFENRGFHLREVTEVQGLESDVQANFVASTIAQRDARQGKATFNGPPNPRHDSYDLLRVDGKKYLETGWSMPLVEGGQMQHTLVLVVS